MSNNNPSSIWKYSGLIMAIIIVIALALVQNFNKTPKLTHYVVKVTPSIRSDDFEKARLTLEDSLFQLANNAIAQDAKLTYSAALDNILPINEKVVDLPGGIVVVIENNGEAAAHNVQIDITLDTPVEEYDIFSKETFSISNEDKSNGILKIDVDKISPTDEVTIVILLSKEYAVFLTALRIDDVQPPVLSTSQVDSMQMVEILTTQTAVAVYNQNNVENLLEFQVKYDIDKISPEIIVVSDEGQSYFYEAPRNKIREQSLFVDTFLE